MHKKGWDGMPKGKMLTKPRATRKAENGKQEQIFAPKSAQTETRQVLIEIMLSNWHFQR